MRHQDFDLDELLRGAAVARRDTADKERIFADVWARLQASTAEPGPAGDELAQRRLDLIAAHDRAARRRRRAVRMASAALAIAVAGGGTAAAAELIAARTGQELPAEQTGSGGSGEVLDLGGSDVLQVLRDATSDIPFAPGYEAQQSWALAFIASEPGAVATESTVRSWMASNAVCTWADAWVADDDAGDSGARATATASLTDSLTWEPVLTFAHDHGEPAPAGSAEGASYYWWLRPLAAAAGSADRQGVLDAVAGGHVCAAEVLPVISADPSYGGAR